MQRDRRLAAARRRAQRDQRGVARRRRGARLHDGARPGRRGREPGLRARDRTRGERRAAGSRASSASSPATASDPGYSLDLMRRRPGLRNGLTEYLIANAALGLGASGVERLSLNFAAWGRLLDERRGRSGSAAGSSGGSRRRSTRSSRSSRCATSTRSSTPSGCRARSSSTTPPTSPRSRCSTRVEGFLELPLVGRFLVPPSVRRRAASRCRLPSGSRAPAHGEPLLT